MCQQGCRMDSGNDCDDRTGQQGPEDRLLIVVASVRLAAPAGQGAGTMKVSSTMRTTGAEGEPSGAVLVGIVAVLQDSGRKSLGSYQS